YLPEVALGLAATFAVAIEGLGAIDGAITREPKGRRTAALTALVVLFALQAIPRAMEREWHFASGAASIERMRGAARDVFDADPSIAVTSRRSWYTSGGRRVWDAFDELRQVAEQTDGFGELLDLPDAVLWDHGEWNSSKGSTPLADWYAQRRLHLRGLVIAGEDGATPSHFGLMLTPRELPLRRAYVLADGDAQRFSAAAGGNAMLAVSVCEGRSSRTSPDLFDTFIPIGPPGNAFARTLLIRIGLRAAVEAEVQADGATCVARDQALGVIQTGSAPEAPPTPIDFFDDYRELAAALGREDRRYEPVGAAEATLDWPRLSLWGRGTPPATAAGPFVVEPPQQAWAYGAVLPLRLPTPAETLVLRVQVRVEAGRAGIGVLNAAETDFVLRQPVPPGRHVLELNLPRTPALGPIVVQNWDAPLHTRVVVERVTIERRRMD
ncbi:MAG: hypothetical protein ACRD15_22620, partial [Vicinamibacterales bacterium]